MWMMRDGQAKNERLQQFAFSGPGSAGDDAMRAVRVFVQVEPDGAVESQADGDAQAAKRWRLPPLFDIKQIGMRQVDKVEEAHAGGQVNLVLTFLQSVQGRKFARNLFCQCQLYPVGAHVMQRLTGEPGGGIVDHTLVREADDAATLARDCLLLRDEVDDGDAELLAQL